MALKFAERTHIGHVRARNEDYHLIDPDRGIVIVADGMGGHPGGAIASKIAAEAVMSWWRASAATRPVDLPLGRLHAALFESVMVAGNAVRDRAAGDRSLRGMGTTLDVAVIGRNRIVYAHVGDGRIYTLPAAGRLRQLTTDHIISSIGALTNCVSARHFTPDCAFFGYDRGDRLLTCTDGLYKNFSNDEISHHLGAGTVEEAADTLLNEALRRGGSDNITFVIVDVE